FLAWFETGSQTQLKDENFRIENVSYQMVKRPEKEKPNERYQVRIDLEFTAQTPDAAQKLRSFLTAPNQFVNPRAEFQWSAQKNSYRASFFLKDVTRYPERR